MISGIAQAVLGSSGVGNYLGQLAQTPMSPIQQATGYATAASNKINSLGGQLMGTGNISLGLLAAALMGR